MDAGLPPFFGSESYADPIAVEVLEQGGIYVALVEDELVAGNEVPRELVRAAASRAELTLVTRLTDRIAIHAGVVAFGDNVVLIPGTSKAGKSTLVQACLARGARYLSDEYALLDSDGLVHSYPRDISVRVDLMTTKRVPPGEASIPWDAAPLPVALVADLHFDAGAGWDVTKLSPAGVITALAQHCVHIHSDPVGSLASLKSAAAQGISGSRGEADATVDELLALL